MRQGVVVIHGIGEQRPMDTLRGFADAVLPSVPNKPKFWSKPDPMSEIFELRKLTAPQTRSRPSTDYYEYYWAYQAQGTKFIHVLAWIRTLLFRRPRSVPKQFRYIWWSLWLLIMATAALMLSGYWARVQGAWQVVEANQLLLLLSSVILLVVSGFVLNYIGDAARYLNPHPSNIELRRRIRAEGVDLLRRLHASKQYDRIVVVGHSLGSIIAYDIIRHLWPTYNASHSRLVEVKQDALKNVQKSGMELDEKCAIEHAENFRKQQIELWIEERNLGNPWLVTDLVTVGSPLAHAELLLARTEEELLQRQAERELSRCPPVPDDNSYSYPVTYEVKNAKRTIFVLHHAAAFACTRWTNIYFPAALGFFGDLVGGSLGGTFGRGIKDVPVYSAEWGGLLRFTPLIHTHYWRKNGLHKKGQHNGRKLALEALLAALDLDSRGWLRKVVAASET